jgi:hypothetical protein
MSRPGLQVVHPQCIGYAQVGTGEGADLTESPFRGGVVDGVLSSSDLCREGA